MELKVKEVLENFCKKENISSSEEDNYSGFYNEQSIKSGRKNKYCDICGTVIPQGEPHFVETDCSSSYPMHRLCRNIALQLYEKYEPEDYNGCGIEDFFSSSKICEKIEKIEEEVSKVM